MNGWGSSAGGRRVLQFVTPAPPPPPAAQDDDDVWGEELPEEALQEAILLESQQYVERSEPPATSHHQPAVTQEKQQWLPRPSSSSEKEPPSSLSELQKLRRDNKALSEQLETAKADKYSHQGEISVLREELTRRCRELENCRLESSRQLQEQQLQLEQDTQALNKQMDSLRTELQFKNHELAEVTRQCRTLRDAPAGPSSPPRKAARLSTAGASPSVHRRFITTSEFRRPETSEVRTGTAATQTELDSEDETCLDDGEVPACHLVSAVLSASGDATWLGDEPLSALAELADQPGFCEERAARAADLVAAAAAARLARFPECVERLQAAADADRRLCTLGSGRRRTEAVRALLQEEAVCVTALSALSRLAEWSAPLSGRLATHGQLTELLPRLLRPAIAEGEVKNMLMMEYTAVLLAAMANQRLPDSLMEAVEPAVHEVFNTKPPAGLVSALLELLISTAGTGQISGLWCRTPRTATDKKLTGTCLVKKLSILFCERPSRGPEMVSERCYRLPASHSRLGPAVQQPASAAAALRDKLNGGQPPPHTISPAPAVDPCTGCGWLRLVALVMSRPAALPSQACCRSHLTLLVVQLLYATVHSWEYGGRAGSGCDSTVTPGRASTRDTSGTLHLISALHRLSDLDPAFSGSVSRERLRYLATMETLGRRWREMRLTAQHVGVLQELYKFAPGTFNGADQSQPA